MKAIFFFSVMSLVIVSTGPFTAISVSWSTEEGSQALLQLA